MVKISEASTVRGWQDGSFTYHFKYRRRTYSFTNTHSPITLANFSSINLVFIFRWSSSPRSHTRSMLSGLKSVFKYVTRPPPLALALPPPILFLHLFILLLLLPPIYPPPLPPPLHPLPETQDQSSPSEVQSLQR